MAEQDSLINDTMRIPKDIPIVIGDGIRFKCQTSTNFHWAFVSYDRKHKYHAFNTIGFCTLKSGKYIGFYPITGVGSDHAHWDGFVLDFLVLNNVNGILNWLQPNSKAFQQDGTRILFDRALGRGCYLFNEGICNMATPNVSFSKPNAKQADLSRLGCTLWRWGIETRFGNLGNISFIF